MRPFGIVRPSSSTSRVVVRASPCTGDVRRRNSSTASGMRPGSARSIVRCSGWRVRSSSAPPSRPVVVSFPPVTRVNPMPRICAIETSSPVFSRPCTSREIMSSPGSPRRFSMSEWRYPNISPTASPAESTLPSAFAAPIAFDQRSKSSRSSRGTPRKWETTRLGRGFRSSAMTSPSPRSRSRSTRSTTNSRIIGSRACTC